VRPALAIVIAAALLAACSSTPPRANYVNDVARVDHFTCGYDRDLDPGRTTVYWTAEVTNLTSQPAYLTVHVAPTSADGAPAPDDSHGAAAVRLDGTGSAHVGNKLDVSRYQGVAGCTVTRVR
jgi:hypothetical protein